jgi:hypothetical protein
MSEGPNVFGGESNVYTKSKNQNLQKIIEENPSQEDRTVFGGLNGAKIVEDIPNFINTASEKVIRKANSWIVLGRDRPASRASGIGGSGGNKCASIDLIVGRQGDADTYVDNNFKVDAARIYIAQRTNIDENFELADGTLIQESKSGIALKADGIRIIGKENIKIITGPFSDETDANNQEQTSYYGIDLIAGNDDSELQPMPLGDNLVDCLTNLIDKVADVASMLDSLASAQTDLESTAQSHTHDGSMGYMGFPLTIIPDMNLLSKNANKSADQMSNVDSSMFDFRQSLEDFKLDYLDSSGSKYICSPHNKAN